MITATTARGKSSKAKTGITIKTEKEIARFEGNPKLQSVLLRGEVLGLLIAIRRKLKNNPAKWRVLCGHLASFLQDQGRASDGKAIPRGKVHLEIESRFPAYPDSPDIWFDDIVTRDQFDRLLRYLDRNLVGKKL